MHRSGKGANDPAIEVVQVVGYIKVNLDTPTPVLREFIRRFCGGWLNEHAKVFVASSDWRSVLKSATARGCHCLSLPSDGVSSSDGDV